MNDLDALRRLVEFIQTTTYDMLSFDVQCHAKKCFLDLAAVICSGAKNKSAQCAAGYVRDNYGTGGVTVLASGWKSTLVGAALANGMAANALDLDDGFSLIRGHPGAGCLGGLLSAAEMVDCTYGEFLAALVVAYEVSIRQGFVTRSFYKWDHSTGSYSTVAIAAGVGKLLGLTWHEQEMALGIADYIMPINPAKRSCYYPSNNKDGIYWGAHAGVEAVLMARSGITGRNPVILEDDYKQYVDSLGKKFYFFDLYIKFFSCCRWAHSPICAIQSLRSKYNFDFRDIKSVDVYSFGRAGTLYKAAPTCEDEAQYNIKYPLAAILLWGDCGPLESSTDKMLDPRIPGLIEKIEFHGCAEYDVVFPAKRLSRVEINMFDGTSYVSDETEPLGDRNADVSVNDLFNKAHKINDIYAPSEVVEDVLRAIMDTDPKEKFVQVYKKIIRLATLNIHPELKFI